MSYKPSEHARLNKDFSAIFGISFSNFYDGLASAITQKLSIDIMKFDDWIHAKHGNYENEGKSLAAIIFEHYGDGGASLIDELI